MAFIIVFELLAFMKAIYRADILIYCVSYAKITIDVLPCANFLSHSVYNIRESCKEWQGEGKYQGEGQY